MKKLTGSVLFESIGYIREDYILEASPYEARRLAAARRRRAAFVRRGAFAACVCLLVIGVFCARMKSGGNDAPANAPGNTVLDAGFEITDGVSLSYSGAGVEIYVPASVKTVSKGTFVTYADAPKVTTLTLTSPETKLEQGALAPLTSLESVIVSDGTGSGVDLSDLLDMTVTDIVNNGCSLSLSYVRYGGNPIYAIKELKGIELVFNSFDLTNSDDMCSPLSGYAKPYTIYLTNETPLDVTVAPGLYIGMDISEARELGCEFLGIYRELDNGHITLQYLFDGYEIHVALVDIPKELCDTLFPWPEDGSTSPSPSEIQETESARTEFVHAPVGKISEIKVYKAIDLDNTDNDHLNFILSGNLALDMDPNELLEMTVAEIEASGRKLVYLYSRYGASPIYALGKYRNNEISIYRGIELEYKPGNHDDKSDLPSSDAKPRAVYVTVGTAADVTVAPGLRFGMDISEAIELGCEFYDVDMDVENSTVTMKYQLGEHEIKVLLDFVAPEIVDSLFPSTDGITPPDPEEAAECEKRRDEFARSPSGVIFSMEISKVGSQAPWLWQEE